MNKKILGQSVQGRSIELYEYGKGKKNLHIYGGIHGDEPESVDAVLRLIELLNKEEKFYSGKHVFIIPNLNPDGFYLKTRVNANKVDLNRNFPTENWSPQFDLPKNNPGKMPISEPEVKAVMNFIKVFPPQAILSVHSWEPQINYDGPGKTLAGFMAKTNGYKVTKNIGYPTPGSLGTWGGEKEIPTITLELPEKVEDYSKVWEKNKEAFLAFLKKG